MFDTGMLNSSLTEYFEELGYTTDNSNGTKTISHFASAEEECHSLHHGVGLRDISLNGLIELRGKDVIDFLHRITTNSLADINKEEIRKTIFTSEKGRIIGLGTLLNFVDYQLLVCGRANKKKVMHWISKYVIGDDVKVADANSKYCLLELIGPQSESFLTLICGNVLNEIEENKFKVLQNEGMIFFLAKLKEFNGDTKFWVIADTLNSKKFIKFALDNKGPFDFNLISDKNYYAYRVEKGLPEAPNELNDNYNPHEADLLNVVDFEKGCYIGQEVIARLDTYDKVQKKLTGVKFEEEIDFNKQFSVYDKERNEIGKITSSTYSLKLKRYIGLAFIRKAYLDNSTKLIAKDANGEEFDISVQKLPFVK